MIKKMVVLFSVISLALISLTACGDKDKDKDKNLSSNQNTTDSQQQMKKEREDKKMEKKILAIMASMAMVVVLFTGCPTTGKKSKEYI